MALKTQPTARPTRKIWAVIATGAIVGGATAALNTVAPGTNWQAVLQDFAPIVTAALVAVAGYVTRDSDD